MKVQKNKKVLIVTYYWPPAGGPGVQRVLNFVKNLPQFGWTPIVLTVQDGEYPAIDKSLCSSIDSKLKVKSTQALEPFSLYKKLIGKEKEHKIDTYILNQKQTSLSKKFMKWIRLNIFIPDARIGWYPYAVANGKKLILQEDIDVIYTCSPPHSLQLIGKKLSRSTNKPWVADFRDPWTSLVAYQGQNRSQLTMKIDTRLENIILKTADQIVVTCNGLKKAFIKDKNIPSDKISVITNGYERLREIEPKCSSDKIVIFYAGNLSEVRIPRALIFALEAINNVKVKKAIEFRIAGNVCQEFLDIVESKGIKHLVNYIGYLSHDKVLAQYAQVDYLLQVVDDVPDNHLFVAGKLFDYMGSKKPIIAIGPKGGEVEEIIDNTDTGWFFGYSENDKILQQLLSILELKMDAQEKFSFKGIEKYSRTELTKRLASLFDKTMTTDSNE